jgi:hypothetical protein
LSLVNLPLQKWEPVVHGDVPPAIKTSQIAAGSSRWAMILSIIAWWRGADIPAPNFLISECTA